MGLRGLRPPLTDLRDGTGKLSARASSVEVGPCLRLPLFVARHTIEKLGAPERLGSGTEADNLRVRSILGACETLLTRLHQSEDGTPPQRRDQSGGLLARSGAAAWSAGPATAR